MKRIVALIALIVAGYVFLPVSFAEEAHEHQIIGGPNGGRLLENTNPRTEFLVEKDRNITITFYDEDLKQVSAEGQSVVVIANTNEGRSQIEFESVSDVLVSKSKLPEAHAVSLVVQVKQTSDGKPKNFRFVYEDHVCEVCKRAEYACICGH